MKSTTVRIGLLVLVAVLALTGLGGTALAAGDLFDDGYKDCLHKTRLRDGQIADLSVNRDSDDETHVNVSWTATDPATWGLGPNAYRTSLVVILDDDSSDTETETLSLGSRKTNFEDVETGVEVTVQMAIVVDTADGKYLISDILEKSIFQSLTEPVFAGDVLRVTAKEVLAVTAKAASTTPSLPAVPAVAGIPHTSETVANGKFYYVGYNENFGNYQAETGLKTRPTTPRLRIGLVHGGEDDNARDDVNFAAYILRIVDEDGDVVSEGDDVATVESNYGTVSLPACREASGAGETAISAIDDCVTAAGFNTAGDSFEVVLGALGARQAYQLPRKLILGATDDSLKDNKVKFSNMRVNEGGEILQPLHNVPFTLDAITPTPAPPNDEALITIRIDRLAVHDDEPTGAVTDDNRNLRSWSTLDVDDVDGQVYVEPPDEYRDFPIDVMSSDETYTITAWAINDDDEVISPVQSLEVHLVNTEHGAAITAITDYLNPADDPATTDTETANAVTKVTTTKFTVLK